MFQLIVAVISIALVAALAIASIFYGGEAFTKSSEKAVVTTLINQGQQISGAVALYKTDKGVSPTAVADLVDEYLASAPAGTKVTGANEWQLNIADNRAEIAFDVGAAQAEDLCEEVANQGAGECDAGYTYFRFAL